MRLFGFFEFGCDWEDGSSGGSPPGPAVISDFYGTGLGQIPIDLRLDEATTNAAGVNAARNDGGAGAVFNASATAGREPTQGAGFITFNTGTQRLGLANEANLNGVHMFTPLRFPAPPTTAYRYPRIIYKGSLGIFLDLTSSTGRVGVRAATGHPLENVDMYLGDPWAFDQWILLEFRYAGGFLTVYKNGQQRDQKPVAMADYMMDTIGGSSVSNGYYYGNIGRCVSMIGNPAGGEASLPIIRSTLAAQYGIALA